MVTELGYSRREAERIAAEAKGRYREIIRKLPEFEKEDRFRMNIVNCALFASFLLCLQELPDTERLSSYYERSMMTPAMKGFCRLGGRKKFSEQDIRSMKKTAELKAADRNRYSWNMDFLPYEDGSGYEARFHRCGICVLMKELGLQEAIPAMCRLDYAMSKAGGADDFVRQHTLASGGPYCDCGYKKKARN